MASAGKDQGGERYWSDGDFQLETHCTMRPGCENGSNSPGAAVTHIPLQRQTYISFLLNNPFSCSSLNSLSLPSIAVHTTASGRGRGILVNTMRRGGQPYIFWGCAFRWTATIFFTSSCGSSLPFQICQCAMHYSVIAEASALRYPIRSSAVQEPLALCSSYTDYRTE